MSRRGGHLAREYAVDPLEILFTRDVMRTNRRSRPAKLSDERPMLDLVLPHPVMAHLDDPLRAVVERMAETGRTRLPVVERGTRRLVGMVLLQDLLHAHTRERVLRIRLPLRESNTAAKES